jgi:hypothetical protein
MNERRSGNDPRPEKELPMSKSFKIQDGDISDGYHTFDELYDHRNLLFLNLCRQLYLSSYWKPDGDGWFILFLDLPCGQISYHLPNKWLFMIPPEIKRRDDAVWDGHTSKVVLARLATPEAPRKE